MFLGIDLGTGSAKAVLVGEDGAEFVGPTSAYEVRVPHPGWAEADPADWDSALAKIVPPLVAGQRVEAIGFSGQMHGAILVDAAHRLVRPAVLWPDTRSATQLESYARLPLEMRRRLANPLATGMAGPSLLWIRDHEPEAYRAAAHVLQPKDFVRLRLTGEIGAEPSDASATLLYDLVADGWYGDTIDALGLARGMLPALNPSASVAGPLRREAADALGLRAATPVAMGAADTAAAILGCGLTEPGDILLTVGTGGQIVSLRDRPRVDPALVTHLYRAAAADRWYAMAAMQNVGLALEWVLRTLKVGWEQAYAEAFAVAPGSEGLSFAPYLSGERTPHLDPAVRGAWVGLGLAHGRGHMLRAAFEGVAFALRQGLEALEAGAPSATSLSVGGGGARDWRWLQLLADVLERPLVPVQTAAAAARGAALLAATACGREIRGASRDPAGRGAVEPGIDRERYAGAYRRFVSLYPRLRGLA
jgi:xylulokinase